MKPSTATADRDIKPFSSWSIRLVLGAPTATLALVTVYCSGTLLWLLWGSAFGPNRHFYEFAALPLMVLLICIVTFIEASLAKLLLSWR